MEYSVLITAAGVGIRSGLSYNKILHKIHDKSVLEYSLDFFDKDSKCKEVIVICSEQDLGFLKNYYKAKSFRFIIGGKTRQESVFAGLIQVKSEYVLVHDAARPFINRNVINKLLQSVQKYKASSVAVPSKNTLVEVQEGLFQKALNRNRIWQVQTPQAFETTLLKEAHQIAIENNYIASDDTTLVAEYSSVIPQYVLGDERSIKLTTPYDIKLLEVIL